MSFRSRFDGLGAGHVHRHDLHDGATAVLRFDHPAARNALSPVMMVALADHVDALERADGVRAVVLGGATPHFCAGGDLAAVQEHLLAPGAAADLQAFMADTCARLARLPARVIAAVEGAALGGGAELLTACDRVYAAPEARVGFVQAAMGVSPGFGGGVRLVQRVGARTALDVLTRARPLDAEAARAAGLVDVVVADPWAEALAHAASLAALPDAAFRAVKPMVAAIDAALARGDRAGAEAVEAGVFERLWGGPEHVAAIERFRRRG